MRTRHAASLMLLGFSSQACYTYTPVDVADVAPPMSIRAELTPAERDRLVDVLPGNDRTLDGLVVENGGHELLLEVEAVSSQRGTRLETLHQRVRVDRAGIVQVEAKEKDNLKTYGLTAAIVAGAVAVIVVALEAGRAGEPGDLGPGTPQDAVVRLLRIPVGR